MISLLECQHSCNHCSVLNIVAQPNAMTSSMTSLGPWGLEGSHWSVDPVFNVKTVSILFRPISALVDIRCNQGYRQAHYCPSSLPNALHGNVSISNYQGLTVIRTSQHMIERHSTWSNVTAHDWTSRHMIERHRTWSNVTAHDRTSQHMIERHGTWWNVTAHDWNQMT